VRGPPGRTIQKHPDRTPCTGRRAAEQSVIGDALLTGFRTELPPEVVVVDAAANLAAASSLALAVALGVSLIVAVQVASGDSMSRRQRWAFAGVWGASMLATAVTAAPAGQWVMPMIAALALPACIFVGRLARRGLHEWVFGAQPGSRDRGGAMT
jgi:hypothetical protein